MPSRRLLCRRKAGTCCTCYMGPQRNQVILPGCPAFFNDVLIKLGVQVPATPDHKERSLALARRILKPEGTLKTSKRGNELQKGRVNLRVTSQSMVETEAALRPPDFWKGQYFFYYFLLLS